MESALIVSSADKSAQSISALLGESGVRAQVTVTNGGDARRLIEDQRFDIVVISAPLRDEHGAELAAHVSESTTAGVILLVRAEHLDEISARVESSGVFVIGTPVSRTIFQHTVRMVSAMETRLVMLQKENTKLQKKIQDMRLVDRAKSVLMQCLKMDENSAHHYMEKQAMDLRCTKAEIAQNIIRTYKN